MNARGVVPGGTVMILEETNWRVFWPACHHAYRLVRYQWNADPENQLHPLPKRGVRRKPAPGTFDGLADEEG
jgi:hypothetical protein